MKWYLSRTHGGEMTELVGTGAVTTQSNHVAAAPINNPILTTHFKITAESQKLSVIRHQSVLPSPLWRVCAFRLHTSAGPQRRRGWPQCLQGDLGPINGINQSGWSCAAPHSPVHPINPEVIWCMKWTDWATVSSNHRTCLMTPC